MTEIHNEYHPVAPIQNYSTKTMGPAEGNFLQVSCEDCPASSICKRIGNFRASCDPKAGTQKIKQDGIAKCLAGTIMLLDKLVTGKDKK
jgi:ribosomal protein S27E